MYRFVEDKNFLKRAQNSCVKDLQELVHLLQEEGISSQFILVGSGGRNMVTQNENGDIDLYFNYYNFTDNYNATNGLDIEYVIAARRDNFEVFKSINNIRYIVFFYRLAFVI